MSNEYDLSEFEDKNLTCVDCKAEFTFTANDQAFYEEKGFNPPRRCKENGCREKARARHDK